MKSTRRSFLACGLTTTAIAATVPLRSWAAPSVRLAGIKALTFDMQGTVFNFYDPLLQTAQAVGRRYGLSENWATTLPGDWSVAAHEIIVDISAGRRPWIPNIQVYRETLMPVLIERHVGDRLSDADRDE